MITVIMGDITEAKTDVIVNAANSHLKPGSGVCGAIYRAAGSSMLNRECRLRLLQIPGGSIPAGQGLMTEGFNLGRMIYHAVGPIYVPGEDRSELLADCYRNTFKAMREYSLKSVAFPSISTGIYGYPLEEAVPVAVKEMLKEKDNFDIFVVCFDSETYNKYNEVFGKCV